MSQTQAYGYNLDKAQAGQKYDIRPDVVASFAAEGAVAFGAPVMRGTNPETQVEVSDASDFVGIALFTQATEAAGYLDKDTVSVLTHGAAWVTSGVANVVAGETAYVTSAAVYTNVEGTNLAVGTFLTSGGSGDLVVVELRPTIVIDTGE
jgi:hypothetical protein